MTVAAMCGALLYFLVGARFAWTPARWSRTIRFRPAEAMSSNELFSYLLSANLALLERDNFNQLSSGLSEARVKQVLAKRWGVTSSYACGRAIAQWRKCLGLNTPADRAALSAWSSGKVVDSESYAALRDTCVFLSLHAYAGVHEISDRHLNSTAWDIQQAAYLVRLGVAAGYVSRGRAQSALAGLQREARMHYASWQDYSLSAIIGMGLRRTVAPHDRESWRRIACSHSVLLEARQTPIAHASPWGPPDAWTGVKPSHSLRLVHASLEPARVQRIRRDGAGPRDSRRAP